MVSPFMEYEFMARAALGGCVLAVAGAPLGVFLILRRMSLVGDAVGHAVLPGAAGAALLTGGSTVLMTLGAALTGLLVFVTAGFASRALRLPEDAGFAVFYLAALASGVMLASAGGGSVDLDRLLFGAALGLDDTALLLAFLAAGASLVIIGILFRPLLLDTLDPQFLRTSGGPKWAGPLAQAAFFGLLALTTVASFHALGALMSIGLTILPAIGARFWAKGVVTMMVYACGLGWLGVIMGLLTSFYADAPAGAAIVASLVAIVILSSLIGPVNSVVSRHLRQVSLVA
ncbi:metal ABC transporter permease [Candidatus Phycosocius spiralis]|nr:metal ABC transporter permease [Candidatus Phycosocius spiralis]